MLLLQKVLEDRDSQFRELTPQEKSKIIIQLANQPSKLFQVLRERDPDFKNLSFEEKKQVWEQLLQDIKQQRGTDLLKSEIAIKQDTQGVEEPPNIFTAGKKVGKALSSVEHAARGLVETGASFGTSTVAFPVSGLGMLYYLGKAFATKGKIDDEDLNAAEEFGNKIASYLQYQPKTEYGRIYNEYLNKVMAIPHEAVVAAGNKLVERGWNPALVTALMTPAEFGAYGVLFKGLEKPFERPATPEIKAPKDFLKPTEEPKTAPKEPEPEIPKEPELKSEAPKEPTKPTEPEVKPEPKSEPAPESVETGKKSEREPWEMTFEEYKKEYFKPGSAYNEEAQETWRTWQKQKLQGIRGKNEELPYGIKDFKGLVDKMARDFHKYEVDLALSRGDKVPEKVLKDYPDLAEKYNIKITPKVEVKESEPVPTPPKETQEIDSSIAIPRTEVRKYRPYPLMGNKEQLISQKGYHEIIKKGVEESDRVIDAFMGTGVNSNILPLITDKKIPVIKNEFNKFRYNVYKALHENPEAVIDGVKKHIETIENIHRQHELYKEAKKEITNYFKEHIEDDPSVYIVAQHFSPSSKPINEPKDIAVDIRKNFKIRNFKLFKSGEIEQRLKNIASVLKEYPHEIRQGDAWKLIAKEAKKGDLVIVDPDYLSEKGRKVAGYGATIEDKNLKTFLRKFDRIILPKAKRGARFIITNTWDEGLAEALKERGFKVFKTKRRSAKSVKDELIATNFDERSGEVYTFHDTANAGRGSGKVRQGLSKEEGQRQDIGYDAGKSKGEVEGTGSARVSDEIRGGGRGLKYRVDKEKEAEPAKSNIEFRPIPEGKRRSAIIKLLSKKLDVPIRIGRFRTNKGKIRGIYKPTEKVIRLAKANDIETLSHEIGHHIQKLLGFPDTLPDEVRKLAYKGADDLDSEGFAEFVRYYITNPSKVKKEAPNFYTEFERRLEMFPDVQDVLDKAREAWHIWQQSSAVARIDSFIVRGGEKKPLLTREKLNQIYTQVKDDLHPLQVLKKEAEKRAGRKLLVFEDPYLLARLTRGWARKAEQFLKYKTFQYDLEKGVKFTGKSLKDILKPVAKRGELSLLEDYLIAKRALNDERILKGFKGIIAKEDFETVVKQLEPKFKDVAEELYKYSDELLKYLVDSGRISEDVAKMIREKNLFYVPFYRVMDYEPPVGGLSSKKFTNLFNPIKRLKGSSRDIYSPLESLIYNTYTMINIAERNRVGHALNEIAKIPGMGKFIERVPFRMKPVKMTKAEALKAIVKDLPEEERKIFLKELKDLPKEELNKLVTTFRPHIKAGPNEAIFYVDGKPVLFELDPELAKALNNVDAANTSVLVKILSYPAQWLRAGATTFSPEFGLRNPARDQLTAFLQSKYGFKPGIDFLRGLFHMIKKDELWQKYNASGAAHSALVSLDRDYLSQNLKKLIGGSKIKGLVKNPLELIQTLSEFTEEATRVGEFARALKKEGGSYEGLLKAGYAGREITMDFARQGGTAARYLNTISAFWNARIEGIDKMIRTFKEQPVKTSAKAFLGITLPSILLWYINKDDPYYQELPEWRKVLFWNIVLHNDDGTLKAIISLPKPFEYGLLFGSTIESALDWIYHDNPDSMKETANQIAQALKLVPLPTATVPIIEWWANKSMFFDRPIVPRGKEILEPVLQYGPHTSKTARVIAEIMDKIPGLKEVASPAKIENLLHGYFAAGGSLALKAGDELIEHFKIIDVPPDPKMTLADIPGIRAFIARFPSANTKSIEDFYKEYNELNRKWESAKERAGIRGYGIKTAIPQKLLRYRAAAKALSILRKKADIIYNSKKLNADEKREMLDNIYLSMINVARAALNKEKI